MFRLDADKPVHFCDGLTRRDFLNAGSLSVLGLTLPDLFTLRTLGAVNPRKDVNCILLMLVGAPSQLDTWDMKPDAPAEIRGPYKPIPTNVPGIQISEILPRMAKLADKYALVRSVYHNAAAVHDTGHQMMQTGWLFQGGIEYPNIGCVLSKLKGPKGDVPPHVLMPHPIGNTGGNMPHGQTAGYLGKTYDPFVLNADPSAPDFKVPDMLPPDYIAAMRVDRRRSWRSAIDQSVSYFESNQDARLMDATFSQAYTLMSSAKAREAFELGQEPDAVRERYGRNRFGQGCLLARRLIERDVRFPERLQNAVSERQSDPSITQALHVITGDTLNEKLRASGGTVDMLLKLGLSDRRITDYLFLAAFSRFPTEKERDEITSDLRTAGGKAS